MKRKMKSGATSQSMPIFVQDSSSTTGAGLALAHDAAGLIGEWRRKGSSSWTSITLAAGVLGTWSEGGWVADGGLVGAYEVGIPNLAIAAGQSWVTIRFRGATNMVPVLIEIELDAVDYQDAADFGLSNLDASISSRLASASYVAQTGDSFARIGSLGSGLSALAQATQIPTSFTESTFTSNGVFSAGALQNAPVTGAAPTVTAIRQEMDANSTKLTTIASDSAAIRVKTDAIPSMFTSSTFASNGVFATSALQNAPVTGAAPTVTAIRQEMDTNSTKLETASTSAAAVLAAMLAAQINGSVDDLVPTSASFKGDSNLSSVSGYYGTSAAASHLLFTSGQNRGIARRIASYVGSTRLFTFTNAFPASVSDNDTFAIMGDSE